MKSFVCNILNKLKSKSETIDAQSILCEKAWIIFNDEGEKETLIFQPDGELILSLNGVTYSGKWRFISANKTVQLQYEGEKTGLMLHPSFKDDYLFALQVDGTEKYAFLIDEGNADACKFKTLSDITNHFKKIEEAKALALLEAEHAKRRKEIEQREQDLKKYNEDLQRQIAIQKEREAAEWQKEKEEIKKLEEQRIKYCNDINKLFSEFVFWSSANGVRLQRELKNVKNSTKYKLRVIIGFLPIILFGVFASIFIVSSIVYLSTDSRIVGWIIVGCVAPCLLLLFFIDYPYSLADKYFLKLKDKYQVVHSGFLFDIDREHLEYMDNYNYLEECDDFLGFLLNEYAKKFGKDSFYTSSQKKFEKLKSKK